MFRFNAAISQLGINEVRLQGRRFTWTNMHTPPLMEKLDWIFISNSWEISYPTMSVCALDRISLDHCPCVVTISTAIPKSIVFRFENYWLQLQGYQQTLNENWNSIPVVSDRAKSVTAKLKNLRKVLREWQSSMRNLKTSIANIRLIILFLETVADLRDLSLAEWNFKQIIEEHPLILLERQRVYCKQRGNVKWVQLGDAGTHFFHTNATLRHRNKLINELENRQGISFTSHSEKEAILWDEFKQRLGVSEFLASQSTLQRLFRDVTTCSSLGYLSLVRKLIILSEPYQITSHLGQMGLIMNS